MTFTKESYLQILGKTEADFYPGKLDEAFTLWANDCAKYPGAPDSFFTQQAAIWANGRLIDKPVEPAPIPTTPVKQKYTTADIDDFLTADQIDDLIAADGVEWLEHWLQINLNRATVVLTAEVFKSLCNQGYKFWVSSGKPVLKLPETTITVTPTQPTQPAPQATTVSTIVKEGDVIITLSRVEAIALRVVLKEIIAQLDELK